MKEKNSKSQLKTLNFTNFYAIKDGRFNKEYLMFAIDRLSYMLGSSKQFIMCSLINEGLKTHPQYSPLKEDIDLQWEEQMAKMAAEEKAEAVTK